MSAASDVYKRQILSVFPFNLKGYRLHSSRVNLLQKYSLSISTCEYRIEAASFPNLDGNSFEQYTDALHRTPHFKF